MKLIKVNVFAVHMLAISAIISVSTYATPHAGAAPTVVVVNSNSAVQPIVQQAQAQDKQVLTQSSNKPVMSATTRPKESVLFHVDHSEQAITPISIDTTQRISEPVSIDNNGSLKGLTRAAPSADLNSNNSVRPVRTDMAVTSVNPAALGALTVIDSITPTMPTKAYEQRNAIPVQPIAHSAQTARVSGDIRGLEVDIFQFNGQQGQTVSITHDNSHPAIEVAIFRPSIGMRFGSVHVLPESGDYELRIVQTRQDAAKNKTPRHYDIGFIIQ